MNQHVILRDEAHEAQQMLRSGASEMAQDARLLYPEDVRRLHGIEGAHRPSLRDEKPDKWTADYLAKRYVEAARIWKRLPDIKRPRKAGNHWPEHQVEYADQLAELTLPKIELDARAEARRRTWMRVRVTPEEIRLAETTQQWMLDLKHDDSMAAIILGHWAIWRARNLSVRVMCEQTGWKTRWVYKVRDRGLEWLVSRLNAKCVPVF